MSLVHRKPHSEKHKQRIAESRQRILYGEHWRAIVAYRDWHYWHMSIKPLEKIWTRGQFLRIVGALLIEDNLKPNDRNVRLNVYAHVAGFMNVPQKTHR